MALWVGPPEDPDRYALTRCISRGVAGELWRGELPLAAAVLDVAVKVGYLGGPLPDHHDPGGEGVPSGADRGLRAWQERAELLRSLEHPALVRVREAFEGPEPHERGQAASVGELRRCLVTGWVDGVSALSWIELEEPGAARVVAVLAPVAEALDGMHRGVVTGEVAVLHGAITPENVLVADGQARLVGAVLEPAVDTAGTLVVATGTAGTLAPQVIAEQRLTAASDRFAFAATVHRLLTGAYPDLLAPERTRERCATLAVGDPGRLGDLLLAGTDPVPEQRPAALAPWLEQVAGAVAGSAALGAAPDGRDSSEVPVSGPPPAPEDRRLAGTGPRPVTTTVTAAATPRRPRTVRPAAAERRRRARRREQHLLAALAFTLIALAVLLVATVQQLGAGPVPWGPGREVLDATGDGRGPAPDGPTELEPEPGPEPEPEPEPEPFAVWQRSERVPEPAGVWLESVASGGGDLVAVGRAASGGDVPWVPVVWRSDDGWSWEPVELPGSPSGQLQGVVHEGGRFLAVGGEVDATGNVRPSWWSSVDGRSWELEWQDLTRVAVVHAVAERDRGLLLVGEVLTDEVWSAAAWLLEDDGSERFAGLGADPGAALAATAWGEQLVVVGQVDGIGASWLSVDDGSTWVSASTETDGSGMLDVVVDGDALLAVGFTDSGTGVWSSQDGRRWHDEPAAGLRPIQLTAVTHTAEGPLVVGTDDTAQGLVALRGAEESWSARSGLALRSRLLGTAPHLALRSATTVGERAVAVGVEVPQWSFGPDDEVVAVVVHGDPRSARPQPSRRVSWMGPAVDRPG